MSSVGGRGVKTNGVRCSSFFSPPFFLLFFGGRTIANVISDPSLPSPSSALIFLGNNEGETGGWKMLLETRSGRHRQMPVGGTTLAPEDRCQAVTWGPANYVITSFPLAGPPPFVSPAEITKYIPHLKTLTHGRLFRHATPVTLPVTPPRWFLLF